MRQGLEWYRREPVSFLGGVQGLTSKQIAVYSVILDLIYQHGGEINNDPSWVAGWIKDMGQASVRKTIKELADMGKLTIEDTKITQKRAKNEAKTKQKLRETRVKTGRKGGENSAKSRAKSNKINSIGEASAIIETQAEKSREDNKNNKKRILLDGFDELMGVYPAKATKYNEAQDLYEEAILSDVDHELIIFAAYRVQSIYFSELPEQRKFTLSLNRWLAERNYETDRKAWERSLEPQEDKPRREPPKPKLNPNHFSKQWEEMKKEVQ